MPILSNLSSVKLGYLLLITYSTLFLNQILLNPYSAQNKVKAHAAYAGASSLAPPFRTLPVRQNYQYIRSHEVIQCLFICLVTLCVTGRMANINFNSFVQSILYGRDKVHLVLASNNNIKYIYARPQACCAIRAYLAFTGICLFVWVAATH